MISGFIVGYLYVFNILSFLQIGESTAQWLQDSFMFSCCRDNSTFVKVSDASRNEIAGGAGLGFGMPNYVRQQNEPSSAMHKFS